MLSAAIYTSLFVLTNIALGYYFIFHTPTPQKPTFKRFIQNFVVAATVLILARFIPTETKISPYYVYVLLTALSGALSLVLIFCIFLLPKQYDVTLKKTFPFLQAIITALTITLGIFLMTQTSVPIETIRIAIRPAIFIIFFLFAILAILVNIKLRRKK